LKNIYKCEICDESFDDRDECMNHEELCNPTTTYTCNKCGKTETWGNKDEEAWIYLETWHNIHLGRMGYGSGLDGSDVNFELCDNCLCEFIRTFIHKESIYNSGSNYYYEIEEYEDIENMTSE
jgi:hypothetical protein